MYKDKKIAVVGVSENPEKFGYQIFTDLIKAGYKAIPVGIRGGNIDGQEIHKTLTDLEQKPDLVVTVIPSAITDGVVDECIKLGIQEIWMQPGSQSPTAAQKAKDAGIKTTAHGCFMSEIKVW
jgi:predicted CoA-binding protein